MVTALAMATFCLGVYQWHAWFPGVGKTYGPAVKTALDAEAQSAEGMVALDLVRHLSLEWEVMAVTRSVAFETISNDLKLKDMIHIPWGSAPYKLIRIVRSRNWSDLRSSGSEDGKGRRSIGA